MPRKIVKKLITRPVKGAASKALAEKRTRRVFTEEFRREAVAMLLDGHSANSVAERLGLASSNVLYRWKAAPGATGGRFGPPVIPLTAVQDLSFSPCFTPSTGGVAQTLL